MTLDIMNSEHTEVNFLNYLLTIRDIQNFFDQISGWLVSNQCKIIWRIQICDQNSLIQFLSTCPNGLKIRNFIS